MFANPNINSLLEGLDITAFDAISMFKLLDRDGSDSIDITEFCDGCLRLKGDAKSFDVHCLIFESQRSIRKLNDLTTQMATKLSGHSIREERGSQLRHERGSQGSMESTFEIRDEVHHLDAPQFTPCRPWSSCSVLEATKTTEDGEFESSH
eukprot:TRINITY_DN68103_c0_g1_i1.p1 TRINITY_DN68103_c0_g1~~TRINITY_DN68103_c0_g1_i1.p1  ORF type:complete len:151 (+),score=23.63 TRINITY_DN68103_c0_g1_i1:59-511(+)